MDSTQPGPFREFKIYDKTRQGRDWMSLLAPHACAVFFKDFQSGAPLSREGLAFDRVKDCTFLLFDGLEDARRFCEAQVKQYPAICCEIFDFEGKAKPPLLVVVHPSVAERDELSESSVRRRKIVAMVAFACAVPLLAGNWRTAADWILPTVVGINLIVFGLRLLYWNTGRNDRLKAQTLRLESHLQRERITREIV
jgi:hypothetical protein